MAVAQHLDRVGHKGPRLLIHADLGRVEWKDSLPTCERLAENLGWELMVVRRKAGDMMDRWLGRWSNNVGRYEQLECVKMILPWSTPSMRFCTSELKVAVITSALKKRFPNQPIINAAGIRREESANRRKMPIASIQPKLERKGLAGMNWNPIIEWRLEEVIGQIQSQQLDLHEGYTRFGMSRISCAFCIMSSGEDMTASAACQDNADIYREMVDLEIVSTYAFQGSRWLADVAPGLLSEEKRGAVQEAKEKAAIRQQLEADIPRSILYVKGWPTAIPDDAQARKLARIRQEISDLLGLNAAYLTRESVQARYHELMQRNIEKSAGKGKPYIAHHPSGEQLQFAW
ncbi:phosphoadenosine phosphosulfate reductase domain-containing protein [Acidithiobacillus marinus]|uniref:phosphoadenosine phosphosulfate reductase domain-containing protein n=1 Tax=Acidithiobacillus marinus TaxID=187490 RepID=UPI00209C2D6C|nr:phosphoadenosine phosphosulfate reductase family protein [Acidithiobacillus marinus]